ncbi:MAG: DJ-1/PfpI family protein [Pseudanabaenaceae cyanobacterium SKYGB_i_bin29]|nr:DJ-1/PfpI family protein [Pseudanabaenaceae cyanobacterium SKYG29]MDW8420254.1 DJ-1/PfpI family protein [Pseudanabaenaceae cyanobacterium SKYGB_i_bin29]
MPAVLVPLIDGFEEMEAITIIDVLRRGEITVITAGVNGKEVTGSHQITVIADTLLSEVKPEEINAIVLPGGPGVKELKENQLLRQMLQHNYRSGQLTAAICAAPLVLSEAGILEGKQVTAYPSVQDQLQCGSYVTEAVVQDGHLLTSRGPGTATSFALALVKYLAGEEKARSVAAAMLVT